MLKLADFKFQTFLYAASLGTSRCAGLVIIMSGLGNSLWNDDKLLICLIHVHNHLANLTTFTVNHHSNRAVNVGI